MQHLIEYIKDWACPVKRMILLDIPLVGFDLAFLVYLAPILAEVNLLVSIFVGLTAAILTSIRIWNELDRMAEEKKKKRKRKEKDEDKDKDEED
jgi:hypothetical protein